MKMLNPYTKVELEYHIDFNLVRRSYTIKHDTPFSQFHASWMVVILMTGDMVYIPCEQNLSRDIYVVTKYYRAKQCSYPHGIYTIPLNHFSTNQMNH